MKGTQTQMKNFDMKNIILGMGIGVVFTALIGMIYSSGKTEMTKQEIIESAKKYGMIEKETFVSNHGNTDVDALFKVEAKSTKPATATPKNDKGSKVKETPKSAKETPKQTKKDIKIETGDSLKMVSGKLFKSGLIKDDMKFQNAMQQQGLNNKIRIGTYSIKTGTDMNEVMNIITKKN